MPETTQKHTFCMTQTEYDQDDLVVFDVVITEDATLASLYDQLGVIIGRLFEHPDCPVWLYNVLGDVVLEAQNRTVNEIRQLRQALDFGFYARRARGIEGIERHEFERGQR